MIYFFIILSIFIYLYFLNTDKPDQLLYKNKLPIVLLIIIFSSFILYIFSTSYDSLNTKEYKEIHTKNLSVRNNIKIIKENIPMLESKLSQNPNDFNGWLMLGKSHSILKDYQNASRAYQIAINLRPNNMDAVKEYILVLRSDSELINKETIKKYFKIYINKTNDAQSLLDQLSFSFTINDNILAQQTLNMIIDHPSIKSKEQYKNLLVQLENNLEMNNSILDINISTKNIYQGYFFIILKKSNINMPFAIKRVRANKNSYLIKITKNDFMIKDNINIPNKFDFVIKHSLSESFSSDNKPVEIYKLGIENYQKVRESALSINF